MKVNSIVMRKLDQMDKISPKERVQLAKCVGRYSKPKTFSDTLAYIAYRIVNAVKAIFGQSDREIAVRIIAKHVGTGKFYLECKKQIGEKVKASGIKSKALKERIHNRFLPLILQTISGTNNALFDQLINLNNGMEERAALKLVEKNFDFYEKKTIMEKNFIKKSFSLDLS